MKNDELKKLGISEIELSELRKASKNIEEDYGLLLKHYPIQYLIGYVNFYGYKINVNENVLIPRYETEYLVEKVINKSKKLFDNKKIDILDLCTGSGAIAVALSKELNSKVTASDISPDAIKIAKENDKENNTNINIIESNLFEKINQKYDIIVSNPPYISHSEKIMDSVYLYEPHLALYADDNGLYFYKKIIKESLNYMKDKSLIAFEIGYTQANEIINIAKEYYPKSSIVCEKDLSGKDRYIFIINE